MMRRLIILYFLLQVGKYPYPIKIYTSILERHTGPSVRLPPRSTLETNKCIYVCQYPSTYVLKLFYFLLWWALKSLRAKINFSYSLKLTWAHLRFGEDNGNPLQCSCRENPMDRGAWYSAVHGAAKSWTWLSNFTFTFYFHALEKGMATHSSDLAFRVPWMGALGGLQCMGSQRVAHD